MWRIERNESNLHEYYNSCRSLTFVVQFCWIIFVFIRGLFFNHYYINLWIEQFRLRQLRIRQFRERSGASCWSNSDG